MDLDRDNKTLVKSSSPVPLVQINSVEKTESCSDHSTQHTHCQEWFPAPVIAPAANVECQEDGNKVLGPGDDSVEACNLLLNIIILCSVGEVFNVRTKLSVFSL